MKIPFIDEAKMVEVISNIDHKQELTKAERLRNLLGKQHRYRAEDFPDAPHAAPPAVAAAPNKAVAAEAAEPKKKAQAAEPKKKSTPPKKKKAARGE